jgi:hypothetical protein
MTNDKARALTEQIESSVNALAAETDAVRKSETFLCWLNAMANFSSYSFNNQILISLQRPSACRVAGFQTWKKLGRHVKKGAKGIAILAPCVYRKKVEADDADSLTVKRLGGFKTCWVFAQEDTEGEPIPNSDDRCCRRRRRTASAPRGCCSETKCRPRLRGNHSTWRRRLLYRWPDCHSPESLHRFQMWSHRS